MSTIFCWLRSIFSALCLTAACNLKVSIHLNTFDITKLRTSSAVHLEVYLASYSSATNVITSFFLMRPVFIESFASHNVLSNYIYLIDTQAQLIEVTKVGTIT